MGRERGRERNREKRVQGEWCRSGAEEERKINGQNTGKYGDREEGGAKKREPAREREREREGGREKERYTYTTFRPLVSRALVNKSKKFPPEQTPHLMSGAC